LTRFVVSPTPETKTVTYRPRLGNRRGPREQRVSTRLVYAIWDVLTRSRYATLTDPAEALRVTDSLNRESA